MNTNPNTRARYRSLHLYLTLVALLSCAHPALAAGTLAPVASGDAPMRIVDHHLRVGVDDGFARTEVTQTFENPNGHTTEAIYTLPLPLGAALSEMRIETGDRTLYGEVVPVEEAEAIYDARRAAGQQAGLATKEGYQRFEFRISAVPAGAHVTLAFAYYQTLTFDDGVAHYLYPLQEGGTYPEAEAFWTRNETVDAVFSADIDLRSAFPIEDVRIPDFGSAASITEEAPGQVHVELRATANLDQDLVLYYRLPDDLPGRVEVRSYRARGEEPGTFMMVLTPGMDLRELTGGRDHVFLVDVSGSMQAKLEAAKLAIREALETFEPGDRVRIFKFSTVAAEVTGGWVEIDGEGGGELMSAVDALQLEDSTNLYAGLELALRHTDADRASALYLITDAVANEGVIDPQRFSDLTTGHDVRVYGLLMGNSGNWPLMELITEVSGGFYEQVSTSDDIFGQIMLARDRIRHEAIHGFEVAIDGGETHLLTHNARTVQRGQQVVIFGRYDEPGPVAFTVDADVTGRSRSYQGEFELPEVDEQNPELERLWAFEHVRWLEYQSQVGLMDPQAAARAIQVLGVDYQLVTDETSMILLSDEAFAELGIDPDNRDRAAREQEARMLRDLADPVDHNVAVEDSFSGAAGSSSPGGSTSTRSGSSGGGGSDDGFGFGGGTIDGDDAGLLLLLGLTLALSRRRTRADG